MRTKRRCASPSPMNVSLISTCSRTVWQRRARERACSISARPERTEAGRES